MSDPTQPVKRVRRPALSAPKPVEPEPRDADDAAEREAIQEEARAAEAAAANEAQAIIDAEESRAEQPPGGPVRSEIRREGHASPVPPGFEPRDGDVLVVTYPEVTLPLPKQYSMMKFGGLIYTRQLRAGDDVDATLEAISSWLRRRAETEGGLKYRRIVAEFIRKGPHE